MRYLQFLPITHIWIRVKCSFIIFIIKDIDLFAVARCDNESTIFALLKLYPSVVLFDQLSLHVLWQESHISLSNQQTGFSSEPQVSAPSVPEGGVTTQPHPLRLYEPHTEQGCRGETATIHTNSTAVLFSIVSLQKEQRWYHGTTAVFL